MSALDKLAGVQGARAAALMRSINDIKILLFAGYAVGYPLAVLAPIYIDPLLESHVIYSKRTYPYAITCLPIYVLLLIAQFLVLKRATKLFPLYASVCVFLIAIIVSLPVFLPELPHFNLVAVGATTAFLSAFSIFVWSAGRPISIDPKSLAFAGNATLEYMKAVFSFVRQGAFACVALFSALFFAAYATGFKFSDMTVTAKADVFLLNVNIGFQIAFYAIYSIVGVARYFFAMNLQILSQFRNIALRLDRDATAKLGRRSSKQTTAGARRSKGDDTADDASV